MSLYKDASLVMIPSAYKDGKLYSIRPTDGSGDFTFSRGSNLAATRVDVNGLIEKGRENLVLQGSDISTQSGSWFANQGGVTTQNATTSPIGTNTASQITANGSNTYSGVRDAGIAMGALRYTYSVYLKAQSGTPDIRLTCYDGVNFYQQDFSITTEWERYSITFTPTAGTHNIYITSTQAVSWYAWGAQFELGLVATDYIETGASTAQAGILEDMPRLDYSGGASCPALLLEPQRTNIVTQSDANANWNMVANVTNALTQDVLSPEGVYNAWASTRNASSSGYTYMVNLGVSPNTTYTASIWLKAADLSVCNEVNFNFHPNSFTGKSTKLSFVDGSVTGDGVVEPYANGWYRVSLTSTSNASIGYFDIGLQPLLNGSTSWGGSDGDVLWYAYGTQVEAGSYPTSYIPTYGSSVTRSFDNMNSQAIVGDLSNNYTLFFDAVRLLDGDGTQRWFYVTGTNTNLQIYFISGNNGLGRLRLFFRGTEGTSDSTITSELGPTEGSRYKMAIVRSEDSLKLFIDGSLIGTNTDNVPDELTYYNVFAGNGGQELNQYAIFPTALTDSECIALTTL